MAAERLGRQWVGIDIWDKAHEVVIARLEQEGLLSNFKLGDVRLIDTPPARTDDGETASRFFGSRYGLKNPKARVGHEANV